MKVGELKHANFSGGSSMGTSRQLGGVASEWVYQLVAVYAVVSTSAVVSNRSIGINIYNGTSLVAQFVPPVIVPASTTAVLTMLPKGVSNSIGAGTIVLCATLAEIVVPTGCRVELFCVNPSAGDLWLGNTTCILKRVG